MRLVVLLALTGTLLARTELVHLRTANSRTYDNGDGTYTAEILPASGLDDTAFPITTGSVYEYYYHGGPYYERYGPRVSYSACSETPTHGWVQFELDAVPDSCTVTHVRFGHFQYENELGVASQLTRAAVDPRSCSDRALYIAVVDGEPLDTICVHDGQQCWVLRNLNPYGVFLLDSLNRAGAETFTIGLRAATLNGTSYGTEGGSLQPFLAVSFGPELPTTADLEVGVPLPFGYPWGAGDSAILIATLRNRGPLAARCIETTLACDGYALVTVVIPEQSPLRTDTVRLPFVAPDTPDTTRSFQLSCYSLADPDHSNDTACFTEFIYPAGTYKSEDFKDARFLPEGWVVHNRRGRENTWMSSSGQGYLDTTLALCLGEPFGDDWLVTDAIRPVPEAADSFGLYYMPNPDMVHDTVEVWVMSSQNVDDTIARAIVATGDSTCYRLYRACLDDYDGREVCIGARFYCYHYNDAFLDKLHFFQVPRPAVAEGSGHRVSARLEFSVEPGIATTSTSLGYSLPGRSVARVEVLSAAGRSELHADLQLTGNTGTIPLDLRGLPTGVYLVRLEAVGFSATQKLIIQR